MIKFDSSCSYNSNMELFIVEQYNLHITLSVLVHFEISTTVYPLFIYEVPLFQVFQQMITMWIYFVLYAKQNVLPNLIYFY